jgi:hypothetical protein
MRRPDAIEMVLFSRNFPGREVIQVSSERCSIRAQWNDECLAKQHDDPQSVHQERAAHRHKIAG